MLNKPSRRSLSDFVLPERKARIESVATDRTRSIVLVLDRVKNAHNISAVMRSADAFGIQELHLIAPELNFTEEISMGSERWLDITLHQESDAAAELLRARGYRFVVLESPEITRQRGKESIPVFKLPFHEKLALVFGNEMTGIGQTFADQAEIHAHIPMLGFVESFNISVAAAITMFCSILGDASGVRKPARISDDDRSALMERWYRSSIRGGDKIADALRTGSTRSEESES